MESVFFAKPGTYIICRTCETLNTLGTKYCSGCGASLEEVGDTMHIPGPSCEETTSVVHHKSPTLPMNRSAFHAHMRATFDKCLEISKAKNADYAGNEDPFANFRLTAHMGNTTVAQGIMVRLSDKMMRISNLLDGRIPKVTDEAIDDTIDDAINYLAILKAWREEEKGVPHG